MTTAPVPLVAITVRFGEQVNVIGVSGAGGVGVTLMARSAGIHVWPPLRLSSRNTSKKLLMRNRVPSGLIVCLPSDCSVGLSRIIYDPMGEVP